MQGKRRNKPVFITLLIMALGLTACGSVQAPPTSTAGHVEHTPTNPPTSAAPSIDFMPLNQQPGEKNYNVYCAHCHGYDGEGQLATTIERTTALGYHLVPPHDSSGHTWMHTDELLLQVIKEGIQNPLDLYIMAGFGGVLTDQEIVDIIDYIKGWWTDEQRAYQRQVTQHARERREELGFDESTSTPES